MYRVNTEEGMVESSTSRYGEVDSSVGPEEIEKKNGRQETDKVNEEKRMIQN